jgi:hypothetical protein
LCILAISKYKVNAESGALKMFRYWSILVVINALIMFLVHFNLYYFALTLKLTLPVYLFYFLRIFIQSKEDLIGILQTFIYSYFIVFILLLYELLFGPRSIQITRGDIERYEGGFADVMNYAIYAIGGVLVILYFFFLKTNTPFIKRIVPLGAGFLFSFLILFKIFHLTSYVAITALILIFCLQLLRRATPYFVIFIFFMAIIYFFVQKPIENSVLRNMTQREIQARDDGRNERRYFNGRMGRWIDRWEDFKEIPITGKIAGSGIVLAASSSLVGIAVHNDLLRIIFSTGYLGLLFYLSFYFGLFRRRKYFFEEEKFLLDASLSMIIIYSVTTLPTLYPPFMYLLLPIFVYFGSDLPSEEGSESWDISDANESSGV